MKSIQTKFTIVLLAGIMVSALLIGSAGIVSAQKAIDKNSVQMMNLLCGENAQELNNTFSRIEQAVEILAVHAEVSLESVEKLVTEEAYLEEYTQHIEGLGLTVANETHGAIAIYYRYNPELLNGTSGFFRVYNKETGLFENTEVTDIDKYDPKDVECVGWYYTPVNEGKAVWMLPYYNQNIDIYMISYVVPIYAEQQLMGVIGIDIDFNFITDKVDEITLYESGYAFLTEKDYTVVHNPYFERGHKIEELSPVSSVRGDLNEHKIDTLYKYTIEGNEKRAAFCKLDNGMYLAVSASLKEIDATKNELIREIAVRTVSIMAIFLIAGWYMTKTMVKPLKEITRVSEEVAKGNLEVEVNYASKDEIGILADSMRETVMQLKKRTEFINHLAYTDSLTGLKNNTAYLQEVIKVKEALKKGNLSFAIFVIDVNGLKKINDEFGHEYGNRLLVKTAELIKDIFPQEHIYRIGGDEFVVFLYNTDEACCHRMEVRAYQKIKEQTGEIQPVIAVGYAVCTKNDICKFKELFQRADKNMYNNKQKQKLQGMNSKINSIIAE